MADCLKKAKEAFSAIIDNSEIESVHDALQRAKANAERTGSDLIDTLQRRAELEISAREADLKTEQLQNLIDMQASVDNLLQIKKWQERGVKNPIVRALLAKIGGSPVQIKGARLSTELKMKEARAKFSREFANEIHDLGANPIWASKDHEVEIVDAIMKTRQGVEVQNPIFRNIAMTVIKFQDALLGGYRSVGLGIHQLEDRVAPNIHNVRRMMSLTSEERTSLKASNQSDYQFIRDRWKNFTLPLLDNARILERTGFDLTVPEQANQFMNNVFDELVNRGKVDQPRSNIVKRLSKPRILHWKDADALVQYNTKFGSGAVQDAIWRELYNGFAKIEFIKDWGINAHTTIDRTLKLADLDPSLKERFGKSKDAVRIKSLLTSLSGGVGEHEGLFGDFMRNFRAFQYISKLGLVTLRAIPDLGLVATEASRAGMNGFHAIGETIKTVFFNLHPEERELFKELIDVGYTHEMGSVFKYDLDEPSYSKIASTAMRAANKLNFMEVWDNRIRAQTLAILSRRFAQVRKLDWAAMSDSDKSIMSLYDMGKSEWDLMRNSGIKIANHKEFITPDSILAMNDDVVSNIMKENGARQPSRNQINNFKEETAKKYRQYLEDRQNHVILRPGVLDKDMLTFGHGVPTTALSNTIFKLFSQFKLYAVNYGRVPLASVLYGQGARDFLEATIGGKGDLRGFAKLTAYMMAGKYASMAATNLVQGYTPPSLSKSDTWIKMLTEPAGIAGLAMGIDYNDLESSAGRIILGPVGGDIAKISRLGKTFIDDVFVNEDFSKTSRSAYSLLKTAVPKYPYSAYVFNNLLMSELEDMASPGTRDRYLRNLEQNQGVVPLF